MVKFNQKYFYFFIVFVAQNVIAGLHDTPEMIKARDELNKFLECAVKISPILKMHYESAIKDEVKNRGGIYCSNGSYISLEREIVNGKKNDYWTNISVEGGNTQRKSIVDGQIMPSNAMKQIHINDVIRFISERYLERDYNRWLNDNSNKKFQDWINEALATDEGCRNYLIQKFKVLDSEPKVIQTPKFFIIPNGNSKNDPHIKKSYQFKKDNP